MNQSTNHQVGNVRALAWTCLGLCIVLVALSALVAATVSSTRGPFDVAPMPASVRWDDIKGGNR